MRSMTKRCWLLFMPLRSGNTSLKVQSIVLKCGPTTRTWNTSKLPKSSIGDRLNGHFTFCILISDFGTGLGAPWASQMHYLVIRIMVLGQVITAT